MRIGLFFEKESLMNPSSSGPPREAVRPVPFTRADFDHSPFVAFYEVTQACDLACLHCRACAQPQRHPDELGHEQSLRLIEQLAEFPKRPMLVLTGGDPMKRDDLPQLVEHGVRAGLNMSLTPSATPLVTERALGALRDAGLSRLAVSLDGVDAETHDQFRGVAGSFDRTLEIMTFARQLGVPLQVNTTITRGNISQLDAMAQLLSARDIVLWSVFFLVPVGRAAAEDRIDALQFEGVFDRLRLHAQQYPFQIKTTEAPHYRRFLLEYRKQADPQQRAAYDEYGSRASLGTNDGKGILFISHAGLIHPSGFMPIVAGIFPWDSVVEVYQRSPLFRALRDANRLRGKCGICEYRHLCGGSRARSYALTGDPLASDPDCAYQPSASAKAG